MATLMFPSTSLQILIPLFFILLCTFPISSTYGDTPSLALNYYASTCPHAEDIVKSEMACEVAANPRTAATILRLHFHDCFVQGCDGSVLLDDTVTLQGEKTANPNMRSLRDFKVVDSIKSMLESECPGVVSCADILAIAARDAVVLTGGPYWDVPLGRKDSKSASLEHANTDIPTPDQGLVTLISKFIYMGLSATDMVALVGAHTIGVARCTSFRQRIYGDFQQTTGGNPVGEQQLKSLKSMCPPMGEDDKVSALDYVTPNIFDNSFYQLLLKGEGLLNSDQEMFSSLLGVETKHLVQRYAEDPLAFFQQFSDSMVKMGNITNPDSFFAGEVRKNCRFVNI